MASEVATRADAGAEEEYDDEVNWSALNPLIAATPRLFTGDISKLIDFLEIPDLPPESDDEEEMEMDEPSSHVDIPGLHTKVLLQQGIHLQYGTPLPDGVSLPPKALPLAPPHHQQRPPAPAILHQRVPLMRLPGQQRQRSFLQRGAPIRQSLSLHSRGSRVPLQQKRAPLQQRPVHSLLLQQRVPLQHDQSLSNSSSSSVDSESTISLLGDLDDVPLVCLGDGEDALITSLVDALSHKRDNEGAKLELPGEPALDPTTLEEVEKDIRIDGMVRLNSICVWLFFCTHFEPCSDARDVLPRMLTNDDDDILDVTECSMEMQGLLSSPRSNNDGSTPITLREATAIWVLSIGNLRGTGKPKAYDNNIKTFIMGLITAANMKYADALIVIIDAVPQALAGTSYRPSAEVLLIAVAVAHTQQVNAFLQFHMASSSEFRRACAASAAMFVQTFLPVAEQFNANIREGREVTLAQLIGNYTHSVVTNQVQLKRPHEIPALHLSQKRRREGAANLYAGSCGLREEADGRPSAFQPVVPRVKTVKEEDQ